MVNILKGTKEGAALTDEKEDLLKSLEAGEQRYRQLFNHMSSGVAVYEAINNGEDFIFRDFNLAAEKIDKIKKEDLIGKSVLEVFPGITKFGLFHIFQKVWETGIPEYHPISQYEDDRISGWRENYVYKLPTGEIVAVYDDITTRKQIEFDLEKYRMELEKTVQERTSELELANEQLSKEIDEHKKTYSEFKQIFNSSVPMCVIDKDFGIVRTNDAFTNFFQFTEEKIIGKKCYKIMRYKKCHTSRCTLTQILNGTLLIEYEKKIILKNSREIFYLVRATPYRDLDGNIIGIVETYTDITQRIKVEQAVMESEEKYRLITESAHDLIRVVDSEYKIEYINEPAHLKILGYTKDEIIEKMRGKIIHSDEIKAAIRFHNKIKKEGEAVREGRFRHKDGHWIWLEVKGKMFIDRDGNKKMLFISRDISERKKYEELLKKFIVTASHQLRTPVSALVQSLYNIRKYNSQLDENTKLKLVEVMSRNVSRLSELIEILLDFSEFDDKTIVSSKIHEALDKKKE